MSLAVVAVLAILLAACQPAPAKPVLTEAAVEALVRSYVRSIDFIRQVDTCRPVGMRDYEGRVRSETEHVQLCLSVFGPGRGSVSATYKGDSLWAATLTGS